MSIQSCFNSSGSNENSLSGPLSFLDKVKCFSIKHAPSAILVVATVVPVVWSDKPDKTPKRFAKSGIVLNLTVQVVWDKH